MSEHEPKILIVDDQRSMRMTLAGVIEDQGYAVTEAEDGYQAIELVTNTFFDLVLMDIKMPGINGVQTFREIKKISPESVVVMMTGFALEDLVKAALEEGAFSVTYKPFDVENVIKLVDSVLDSLLILVVDDYSSDRNTLTAILTDKGYKVAEAVDGLEAIQMVEHRRYDIILMDINLPDKDGIATFEEIRAIRPDARAIFITGLEVEESVRKALASDALAIAYKPFDVERILAMVKELAPVKIA